MKKYIFKLGQNDLNSQQKIGLFFSLGIAAILIFLHFPFGGYDTTEFKGFRHYLLSDSGNENKIESFDGYNSMLHSCSKSIDSIAGTEIVTETCRGVRSFFQWTSVDPIIPWLGSVGKTIIAVVFTLLLGALWLWLFRNDSAGQK